MITLRREDIWPAMSSTLSMHEGMPFLYTEATRVMIRFICL